MQNQDAVPTVSLNQTVHEAVLQETAREAFVEQFVVVGSRDGRAQIPRTKKYLETDTDSTLMVGTPDYAFKNYTEGSLPALHKAIIANDALPWEQAEVTVHRFGSKMSGYRLTALGRRIVLCCKQYEAEWSVAYVNHAFHPVTTVMLRAMKRHALSISQLADQDTKFTQSLALVTLLTRLVRFVRRVCSSWRFINALNAHIRQAQDNFDSAREYVYCAAGEHSRLLILRIDLYFNPYYAVEQADWHIVNFLRWLRGKACRNNLLTGYLGFIIKRENGIVRGMHWHLMVFCIGNAQCSAEYLTRELGETWAKRTGQGIGCYHNCYADRERYRFNGLGQLELDDWEKMAGLRAALYYMTKQDCVLKASNDKIRNFWRSPIPRKNGKKRGRPRDQDDSLKLLKRMLGGKRSKYPPGFKLKRATSVYSTSEEHV